MNHHVDQPALAISWRPDVPRSLVDEFLNDVKSDSVPVASREQGAGIFAGIGWLMETAIAVYVVRPYLDSMLSELGKDHYKILKRATVSLYEKASSLRISRVATPGKIREESIYSPAFSIVVASGEGINFKFLIQPELNNDQAALAFEGFYAFVVSMVDGSVTPDSLNELEKTRVIGKTLLLAYDFSAGKIIPVDPLAKPESH